MKSFEFAGQNYTIGEINGTECVWGTEAGESNAEVLDDVSTWWAGDADQIEAFLVAASGLSTEGIVQLGNGNWGVVGDECTEDDAWGEYADMATAARAREALEASDWDANVVTGLKL